MKENKNKSLENAIKKAEMILPLLDPGLSKHERVEKQGKIALTSNKSYRTISRYVESYKALGVEGLVSRSYGKKGKKKISTEAYNRAISLRKELPSRSVSDIIYILESEGLTEKGEVKRSTLQKDLQDDGYSRKEMRSREYGSDAAVFRFKKKNRMDMIQADIKYGPRVYTKDNKRGKKTYLSLFIDDASRFVLGGKFYTSQSEESIVSSFKEVIENYGTPLVLYTDNGSQYISRYLRTTCTYLGIKLLHAKVRSPESKGVVERVNEDIERFCKEASFEHFSSLDELNASFTTYLEEKHQDSPHSSLDGKTPREVFFGDKTVLRKVEDEILNKAFLRTTTRKVFHDCTISIYGKYYEVDNPDLSGREVTVSYDPMNMEKLTITLHGFPPSTAKPLEIGEDIDFKKRDKIREERKKEKASIVPPSNSALLNAQKNNYKKKYPNSSRYKDKEENNPTTLKEKGEAPLANFKDLNKGEENE